MVYLMITELMHESSYKIRLQNLLLQATANYDYQSRLPLSNCHWIRWRRWMHGTNWNRVVEHKLSHSYHFWNEEPNCELPNEIDQRDELHLLESRELLQTILVLALQRSSAFPQ